MDPVRALVLAAVLLLASPVAADDGLRRLSDSLRTAPIPPGASPYLPDGRTLSGDGVAIPCRCRFQGRDVGLGRSVCMATPAGTVMSRCILIDNVTSWQPSATPCTLSFAAPATTLAGAP